MPRYAEQLSRARRAGAAARAGDGRIDEARPKRWRATTPSSWPTRTNTRSRACTPTARCSRRSPACSRATTRSSSTSRRRCSRATDPAHRRAAQDALRRVDAAGFKLLKSLKGLRGTAFDPFGHTGERRTERALIAEYEQTVERAARRPRRRQTTRARRRSPPSRRRSAASATSRSAPRRRAQEVRRADGSASTPREPSAPQRSGDACESPISRTTPTRQHSSASGWKRRATSATTSTADTRCSAARARVVRPVPARLAPARY